MGWAGWGLDGWTGWSRLVLIGGEVVKVVEYLELVDYLLSFNRIAGTIDVEGLACA